MEQIFPLLLWGGLFFLMMRFGCGSHMFGHGHGKKGHESGHQAHGHGCCGPSPAKKTGNPADAPSPSASNQDPVCGVTVSAENAKTSYHGGKVYYFCSRECREVFEAAPDLYGSAAKAPPPAPNSRLPARQP